MKFLPTKSHHFNITDQPAPATRCKLPANGQQSPQAPAKDLGNSTAEIPTPLLIGVRGFPRQDQVKWYGDSSAH